MKKQNIWRDLLKSKETDSVIKKLLTTTTKTETVGFTSMCSVAQSCLTLCDSMDWWVHVELLCPWNFPGKNSGVGSHSLFQGIFSTSQFSSKFYKHLKISLQQSFLNSCKQPKRRNSFYQTSITHPKPHTDIDNTTKENYRPIYLMNTDMKILSKVHANSTAH